MARIQDMGKLGTGIEGQGVLGGRAVWAVVEVSGGVPVCLPRFPEILPPRRKHALVRGRGQENALIMTLGQGKWVAV